MRLKSRSDSRNIAGTLVRLDRTEQSVFEHPIKSVLQRLRQREDIGTLVYFSPDSRIFQSFFERIWGKVQSYDYAFRRGGGDGPDIVPRAAARNEHVSR
jgi:hypothetical protein